MTNKQDATAADAVWDEQQRDDAHRRARVAQLAEKLLIANCREFQEWNEATSEWFIGEAFELAEMFVTEAEKRMKEST